MREHHRISQDPFRKVLTVIQTNIVWTHILITKSSPSYQYLVFSQLGKIFSSATFFSPTDAAYLNGIRQFTMMYQVVSGILPEFTNRT